MKSRIQFFEGQCRKPKDELQLSYAESTYNQLKKQFVEKTHQLKAKEKSNDFETQVFLLDECNIILET